LSEVADVFGGALLRYSATSSFDRVVEDTLKAQIKR
jgi:hypothetical protein